MPTDYLTDLVPSLTTGVGYIADVAVAIAPVAIAGGAVVWAVRKGVSAVFGRGL